MTKKELLEELKDLPDDTVIYIEYDYDDICVKYVCIGNDGSDGTQAEVTLIGE